MQPANQILLGFTTSPPSDTVEIKYSNRDNLYYIRNTATQRVDIDFTLRVPDEPPLPKNIKAIVDDYLSFTDGALEFDKDAATLTGIDYLEAIWEQRKGACRHHAFAFKRFLDDTFNDTYVRTPIRVIFNDCHTFVEVHRFEQWYRCDLGGYAAKLVINDNKETNKAVLQYPVVISTLDSIQLKHALLILNYSQQQFLNCHLALCQIREVNEGLTLKVQFQMQMISERKNLAHPSIVDWMITME